MLQAWHCWQSKSPESFQRALELMAAAIAADSRNYRAHAGYVDICATLATFGLMSAKEAIARAGPAADAAASIAPDASESWEARGTFQTILQWRCHEGAVSYQRALEINPSNVMAHHGLGINCYTASGDFDRAVSHMRMAVALDPLSPIAASELTYALTYAGRSEEALEACRRSLEADPGSARLQCDIAYCLIRLGRPAEAIEVFERNTAVRTQVFGSAFYAWALAADGRAAEAEAALEVFRQTCPNGEFMTEVAPLALLELGRRSEALSLLEDLVARRDPQMRYMAVEPNFQQFRGEPRFDALLARIGFD